MCSSPMPLPALEEDSRRIISARRATRNERKIMKKAISSDLPEESCRQLADLTALAEEDIDTSDIPEVLD